MSAKANALQSPVSSLAEMPATGASNTSAASQYSIIGKSITIKGQIEASDPVYVYGNVEGSIHAAAHRVTVGKEGRVKADISAREVVIMGEVWGGVDGGERVEIRSDGSLMGDVTTARIYVEEGAVLSGSIDVHKPSKKMREGAREEQDGEAQESGLERKGVVSFPTPELAEEIAS